MIQCVSPQSHRVTIEREKNPEARSSQPFRKSACAGEEVDSRRLITLIGPTDPLNAICRAEAPDFTGIARRVSSTANLLPVSCKVSQEPVSEARWNELREHSSPIAGRKTFERESEFAIDSKSTQDSISVRPKRRGRDGPRPARTLVQE